MHAMQYRIPLPADYDMSTIRQRVADKGAALDNFAGLGLKAYLIREVGVQGSAINEYAPFYLWSDVDAMNQFLYGGIGFGGIIASFGRPAVGHYNGLVAVAGDAATSAPAWATLETTPIPQHEDPHHVANEATERAHELATQGNIHTVAVAIDPTTWNLHTFTLTTTPPTSKPSMPSGGATTAECFEVLHLSKPEYARISKPSAHA